MHERIIVENERLKMNQTPHLRGKAVQLIVTQIQVQQISQVNEKLIGNVVNAGGKKSKNKEMRQQQEL